MGWLTAPRPVATVLMGVFVAGTAFWLFFLLICRDGGKEALLDEWTAVAAFFVDAGQKMLSGPRDV
jgi:hypothetical protein